jgi:hypothetical protein
LENELKRKKTLIEQQKSTWPTHVIGDLQSALEITDERIGEINC